MRFIIIALILVTIGCSESAEPTHSSLIYLPPAEYLKEGVVSKFYFHRGKINGQAKTDILYRKMVLNDDILTNEDYDAGFDKNYEYTVKLEGAKWKTISEKSITYRNIDTELFKEYNYIFDDNVHTDWESNEAKLIKTVDFEVGVNKIITNQTGSRDSLSEGKRMKIINSTRVAYPIVDGEEKESSNFNITKQYKEGLGLTNSLMINDEYKFELVLDEVMTLSEFERRSNHGTHRVGYIDTLKTLDDYTQFRPCFHPSKINDYYNDKRAEFKGGKGRLRALLSEKLDSSKIEGESGFLTFRFVVNCEGKAGWFVTEEAGFDYQKKEFSEACRMHLFELLKSEKEWINLIIGEEARDAYTYITFKIKNGEIIEILP